jgi:hypothetical protein
LTSRFGSRRGARAGGQGPPEEIDAVGDPAELLPKLDQARRVEAKRKADVDAFLREHLDTILAGPRSEAETVAAKANAKARA